MRAKFPPDFLAKRGVGYCQYLAGCSKRPDFSPARPWRAETRLVPSEAAASEEARRTLGYVEPRSEARTKLADFFSIMLVVRGGNLKEERPNASSNLAAHLDRPLRQTVARTSPRPPTRHHPSR